MYVRQSNLMKEQLTKPFKAILYNKEKVEDVGACICPPYDVITDKGLYLKKSDYNIIRLELPQAEPPLDEYESAKKIMTEWLKKKVLIEDKKDSIYVYEQKFIFNKKVYTRMGFVALNKIDRDRVLIHEATRSKAKQDRERLISTLKAYTSFVFGLYEDRDNKIEDVLLQSKKSLLYMFVDENSIENRIYKISEKKELKELCKLMEGKKIYIADGHHRLDVSYRLKMDYIPIYLTNMYSDSIIIWPYHRIITFKKQRSLYDLIKTLSEYGEIENKTIINSNTIDDCIEIISKEQRPSYAFYSKEDMNNLFILKLERQIQFREEIHDVLKRLKVNILHAGILNNLLGIEEEEISFTQEPHKFIEALKKGDIDLIVLLPPTTVDEVKAVADNFLYMPPKSTFFFPKISTGPIIYSYDKYRTGIEFDRKL